MNLEIKDNKKDPFIQRELVSGVIFFEGKTPSRVEVQKELSKQLHAGEELIVIQKIKTKFGEESALFSAHKYEKKEDIDKIEPRHLLEKGKPKKEKEAATEEKQ
ncbi:MAG: hypothetical protein V1743_07815 [Nanoarchaeota archaeon]